MGKKGGPLAPELCLGGTTKNRLTYDALSMSQWVSGFAQIIRDESNQKTRDNMLDYLADLMEDSHDFGWSSAKGSHAVLLCKMENKINWSETQKIDRVRQVHAQRSSHNYHAKSKASKNPITCKFFQKGSCHQKTDHEINGQMYLHVCQNCFQQGKSHPHPAKDCRTRSKNCFPERLIVNKKLVNAESLNWRNDYHKYAGWSYADTVKGKNSGVLEVSASVNVAERGHCINHSEKSVNTLSNIKTRPASIHRQCSVHVNKSTERKICSIFNRKSKGKAVTIMSDGSYDKKHSTDWYKS